MKIDVVKKIKMSIGETYACLIFDLHEVRGNKKHLNGNNNRIAKLFRRKRFTRNLIVVYQRLENVVYKQPQT